MLCPDPNGGRKDSIRFNPAGPDACGPNSIAYKFACWFEPDDVTIVANVDRRPVIMQLSASQNHDRLFATSQNSGNVQQKCEPMDCWQLNAP